MAATSWEKLLRNTLTQYAGTGLSMITGLLLVPLIIRRIGLVDFGMWALASGLVGSLGLLDAGLQPTLTKKVAEALALNDESGLGKTAGRVLAMYLIIGILAGTVMCGLAVFAGRVFHLQPGDVDRFRLVIVIVGFQLAMTFPLSTWTGIISGLQDFHFLSALAIAINLGRFILTIVLLKIGFGLVSLIWLGLFATCLSGLASIIWVRRRLPALKINVPRPFFSGTGDLLRFSGAMFVWAIAGRILLESPRLIIGVFLPVASIGTYEVGLRICNYSRSILYPMFTFLPAASDLNARNETARLRELYLVGTKYFLLAYAFVAGAVLLFGKQFILLWLGSGFEQSALIMNVLVLGTLYQSQNMVAHVILPGIGRLRAFTFIMGAYPIVNVALSVILLKRYGLTGVAFGTVASYLLLETIFVFFITSILNVTLGRLLITCHLPVVIILSPALLIGYYVNVMVGRTSWLALLLCATAFAVSFAAALLSYGLSRPERARIRAVASRLILRPA
jgi:O-antigen/teichoic acid export membrane protein